MVCSPFPDTVEWEFSASWKGVKPPGYGTPASSSQYCRAGSEATGEEVL